MAALLLIAVAWIYIVLLMAAAEAFGPGGSLLGALVTFVGYGVLPLGIVLYVGSTGIRRRRRLAADERGDASFGPTSVLKPASDSAADDPGRGGHPASEAVAPVGEEP